MAITSSLSRAKRAFDASMIGKFWHGLNFIEYHYLYFVVTTLLASVIVYGTSTGTQVSYTDSFFLAVSAMTEAGLNTVNLSQLNTAQQSVLFTLLFMGSSIFVSIFTLYMRRRAFKERCNEVIRLLKERRTRRRSLSASNRHFTRDAALSTSESGTEGIEKTIESAFRSTPNVSSDPGASISRRHVQFSDSKTQQSASADDRIEEAEDQLQSEYPHYLTHLNTGRNAEFVGLSREERLHLGGVEFRAISFLFWFVLGYFVVLQAIICIVLGAYINAYYADVCRENGLRPWWVGFFMGVSAFNNSGMSLLDANMIPFGHSYTVQIFMGFAILAGNTAFPIFLRALIWLLLELVDLCYRSPERHPELKSTLRFILKYPRRVFTNLFPAEHTWWLFAMIILLNGTDWAGFEAFNRHNPVVTSIVPIGYRVSSGLFQACAVRSGGFYIIPIANLRIANLVLYMIMMYISAFPVTITMRHSNVYEERSLGIYHAEYKDDSEDSSVVTAEMGFKRHAHRALSIVGLAPKEARSPASGHHRSDLITISTQLISQQISKMLYNDLPLLVIALLFITAIESANFMRDPVTYSVFNIAFEIVSGYGCVGISTGLPSEAYSFCGGWHVTSKLILCAVMLKGRHRGLPVAIDKAVRLPGAEEIEGAWAAEDDAARRKSHDGRRSILSIP